MKYLLHKIWSFLSKKWTKRFLWLLLLFGVSGIFLQDAGILEVPTVYAKDEITTHDTLQDRAIIMNNLLKVIYIILWPLIALAGISLDNTLVYGSIFHLDVPLWKLWNIMKNFANFALGFLVLFEILKSIFGWFNKESAIWWPMKIIKNALIAGVLIQASWFLTAAVIDVSTIATYAVWWLPMSILKNGKWTTKEVADTPILGVHTDIQYKDSRETEDGFDFWYTYGDSNKISPCKYENYKDITFIVWKTNWSFFWINNSDSYEKWLCVHHNHSLIKFIDFEKEIYLDHADSNNSINNPKYQEQLEILVKEAGKNPGIWTKYIEQGHFINTQNFWEWYKWTEKIWTEWWDEWLKTQNGTTISKLIWKSKGFSHALITLYNSLLEFAHMSDFDITVKWAGGAWIEMLIKTIFAAALIIPLLILTIVLLARIAYLWLVIAFSPLLILSRLFFKDSKWLWDLWDKIPKIWDLIWVIFAPVITVFVLSLSVIFMTVLSNMLNNNRDAFFEELNIRTVWVWDNEMFDIGGYMRMTAKWDNSSGFGNAQDLISWLIINLFAIGIVWTLLFGAIKANKIWATVVNKIPGIDKWLWTALKSLPIIPVKDENGNITGGVGIWSAINVLWQKPNAIMNSITTKWSKKFSKWFFPDTKPISKKQYTNVANYLANNPNATLEDALSNSDISISTDEYVKSMFTQKWGFDDIKNSNITAIDKNTYTGNKSKQHVLALLNSWKLTWYHWGSTITTTDWDYHISTTKSQTSWRIIYTLTKVENGDDTNSDEFKEKIETNLKKQIDYYKQELENSGKKTTEIEEEVKKLRQDINNGNSDNYSNENIIN